MADHNHKGSVAYYFIIALVLGAITYIEFAIVEYEIAWLSDLWILILLVVLSLVKFFLVIAIYMHLKDDDAMYTGFFSSGMVIALGTFVALSFLFTVRSVANTNTVTASEGHAKTSHKEDGHDKDDHEFVLEERSLEESLIAPSPKNQRFSVSLPSATAASFSLKESAGFTASTEVTTEESTEETAEQTETIVNPPNYLDWFRANKEKSFEESAHPVAKDIYLNAAAAEAALSQTFPYAEGSILLKERTDPDSLSVTTLYTMQKVNGFDPDNNDWQYGVFERSDAGFTGGWMPQENAAMCIGCHTGAADKDYTFLSYLSAATDVMTEESMEEAEEAEMEASSITEGDESSEEAEEAGTDEAMEMSSMTEAETEETEESMADANVDAEATSTAETASSSFEWQALGETAYTTNCSACHQASGEGIAGAFPPLAGHMPNLYNAEGGKAYIINVVLYGLQGTIDIDGTSYTGVMPPWQQLSDEDIAAALNHELTSWGNVDLLEDFSPILPEDVAAERDKGLSSSDVLGLRPEF